MLYNIYLSSGTTFLDNDSVILAIDRILLDKLVEAYWRGVYEIKYIGKTYKIESYYFQIYQVPQNLGTDREHIEDFFHKAREDHFNNRWQEEIFSKVCENVTSTFLNGREWGELKDDLYNVYINSNGDRYIKTTVEKEELEKFIRDWHDGESSGWLEGKQIILKDPKAFVIYDISLKYRLENRGETKKYLSKQIRLLYTNKWTTEALEDFGKDVTSEFKIGAYASQGLAVTINSKKTTVVEKKRGRIFISHSSKDKQIVKRFTDQILTLSLGIAQSEIFCTSIEGMGIKSGQVFRERIKKELEEAEIVIQMISKDYKMSEVCLNEMGAAWVLAPNVIPLVIDGDYDIGFIHNTTQQLRLTKKSDILQFIDDWGHLFPSKVKHQAIDGHIEEFLKDRK